ncbi:MAG: DNA N-6-adenine-methyltransferase [Caldilineaceae bacterium]
MTAGRSINSKSQDWGTPPQYVQAVKAVFGGKIDLDPCSSEYSIVDARVEYRLPKCDGLSASWNYPTIYVNPPYGADRGRGASIKQWLARCAEAHEVYDAEVIALVPVAVNTGHWKKNVFGKAAAICFLYDTRLKFLENGQPGGKGAPMACATIYWGRNFSRFYDVFIQYGAVVDIRPLVGETIGPQNHPASSGETQKTLSEL